MDESFSLLDLDEKRTELADIVLIRAMENVLAVGMEERKEKKKKENPSKMWAKKAKWRISEKMMGLISRILYSAFYKNPHHVQAAFTLRLVSSLIGAAEECDKHAGWNACTVLSEIVKGSSIGQVVLMAEMRIHQRCLALLGHLSGNGAPLCTKCICEFLNRLTPTTARNSSPSIDPAMDVSTETKREEMMKTIAGDVVEWLGKEERGLGWRELMSGTVRHGNLAVAVMVMRGGIGEIGREILVSAMRKGKNESFGGCEVFPEMWEKRMMADVEEEKKEWIRLLRWTVEEEGEEEGVMDGIVGMMNNPFIKKGLDGFSCDVFGENEIDHLKDSLKKLCAFLG